MAFLLHQFNLDKRAWRASRGAVAGAPPVHFTVAQRHNWDPPHYRAKAGCGMRNWTPSPSFLICWVHRSLGREVEISIWSCLDHCYSIAMQGYRYRFHFVTVWAQLFRESGDSTGSLQKTLRVFTAKRWVITLNCQTDCQMNSLPYRTNVRWEQCALKFKIRTVSSVSVLDKLPPRAQLSHNYLITLKSVVKVWILTCVNLYFCILLLLFFLS